MADAPDEIKLIKQVQVQKDNAALDLLSVVRIPDTNQVFTGGNTGQIYHLDLAEAAPAITSRNVSVINCRMIRLRPAPKASPRPNSF